MQTEWRIRSGSVTVHSCICYQLFGGLFIYDSVTPTMCYGLDLHDPSGKYRWQSYNYLKYIILVQLHDALNQLDSTSLNEGLYGCTC